MTPYIPQLTLPDVIFQIPAVSILLPVTLGVGVGFGTSCKLETDSALQKQSQLPLALQCRALFLPFLHRLTKLIFIP
jgi:hypothetical protein